MPDLVKRYRRITVFVMVAGALMIGGAVILRGQPRLFPDLLTKANAAYARGDWERASSLAQRRLSEAPGDVQALRLMARAAARQEQNKKAIAIYNRLVVGDLEPNDFFLMGRALSGTGQIESAFKAYEMAQEGNPDHPETLEALAQLYLQNDRYNAAESSAERLARQPAWEAQAQLMLGTARAEIQDPDGAAKALRRWLELDPEGRAASPHLVASFRKLFARSLLRSRQPAEARQVLEALLHNGPDEEARWLLSRCFIQQRDWNRAAELLKEGTSYRAENPLEFEPAPYVGAARCAACHRPQFEAVAASRHAATFARARDLGSLSLPKEPLRDPGNPPVTHKLHRENDALVVETRVDQKVLRAVVEYAFGSLDHYTTFVGKDDQGRSFMIRMSKYDSPRGSGWDISTGLPDRPEDHDEYLGKKMPPGDGVRRCLYCHTTNPRAVRVEVGAEAADHSIGCERCHGPGEHHLASVEAQFSDMAIASPGEAPAGAINELCGKCHSMHRPEVLSAPPTDPVWSRFQALTLTWSRCHRESSGDLSCATCHDPHRNRETSPARNEAKCLGCHGGPSSRATDSTLTPTSAGPISSAPAKPTSRRAKTVCPVNPASGCIECHMPRHWQEGTHSFKTDHFIRVHERPASAG
jgi:tetratricopeptide (TPR) repeat protein